MIFGVQRNARKQRHSAQYAHKASLQREPLALRRAREPLRGVEPYLSDWRGKTRAGNRQSLSIVKIETHNIVYTVFLSISNPPFSYNYLYNFSTL